MSFDATQRIRPARQTLEDAYDVPGKKFYYTVLAYSHDKKGKYISYYVSEVNLTGQNQSLKCC